MDSFPSGRSAATRRCASRSPRWSFERILSRPRLGHVRVRRFGRKRSLVAIKPSRWRCKRLDLAFWRSRVEFGSGQPAFPCAEAGTVTTRCEERPVLITALPTCATRRFVHWLNRHRLRARDRRTDPGSSTPPARKQLRTQEAPRFQIRSPAPASGMNARAPLKRSETRAGTVSESWKQWGKQRGRMIPEGIG